MRKTLVLLSLAVLFCNAGAWAQTAAPAAPWWNEDWNRRAPLVLPSPGVALEGVPLVVSGRQLQELAGGESFSTGSLRVIGPQGEVPCQYDEYDGTGALVSAPNHELDEDDELWFQADLPAQGPAEYWLYWNTTPRPPGRYEVTVRVHDPVEPTSLAGDVQFHNRACLIGLRGPATEEDPTKNTPKNWHSGTLTYIDMFRQRVGGGFPSGALFASPGTEIKKWSAPRQIAWGPVRCGAQIVLPEGTVNLGDDQTARVKVEHRAWLFDRGAWVLFEELVTPLDPIAKWRRTYLTQWRLNPDGSDKIFYSIQGEPKLYQPSADELQHGTGLRFNQPTDPWMVKYSPSEHLLTGAVLNEGEPREGDLREGGSYGYADINLRHYDTLNNLAPNETLRRRFWYLGFQGDYGDGALAYAVPQVLSSRAASLGAVEKRGGG
ncbi:MAG: DUF4861 domain-containing protein [candidate division WS1 bacterium]|nr:DUF4861 domain-containing protein [candidate division WS1 bacterium]